MSDTGTPTTSSAPAAPAPGGASPGVAETIAVQQAAAGVAPQQVGESTDDYRSRYEREVQDRIRERNMYRPATRLLADLDEGSQAHLMALAQAARDGDVERIIELSTQTIEASSGGKSAAEVIAERQQRQRAAEQPGVQPGAAPAVGMTAEQIQQMVAETIAKTTRDNSAREYIAGVMRDAGFPMDTPAGAAIIRYCAQNKVDPEEGIAWFQADLDARLAARSGATPPDPAAIAAATAAGAALPGVAPVGQAVAGTAATNMSSRERAISRLQGRPVA